MGPPPLANAYRSGARVVLAISGLSFKEPRNFGEPQTLKEAKHGTVLSIFVAWIVVLRFVGTQHRA